MIVADEPVSNLDASCAARSSQLLLELRDDARPHDPRRHPRPGPRLDRSPTAWRSCTWAGSSRSDPPRRSSSTRYHPYTKALLDVVPEAGGLERPILAGEPPDPTRIPTGCRFHPRCPVVASGEAAELGIEAKCKGEDLGLLELGNEHFAACHAANLESSSLAAPAP